MICLLILTIGLLPSPAEAREIKMELIPLEKSGIDEYSRGQYLHELDWPADELAGVPDVGDGEKWLIQAVLGDGKNNTYPILVLQSGAEENPCLMMDMNQNNDFSDEQAVAMKKEEQSGDFKVYTSIPFNVAIEAGGGNSPYRASLIMNWYEGRVHHFKLESRCCRKGKIPLGEEEHEAVLLDRNANGLFNDTDWDTDTIYVKRFEHEGHSISWEASSRVVIKDGFWFYFEPKPDGSSIRARGEPKTMATLTCNLKNFTLEVQSSDTGALNLEALDGVVRLPPGEYIWSDYHGQDDIGNKKRYTFTSGTMMREPFTVKAEENHLDLCLPLTQELSTRTAGDEVIISEQIKGRYWENVYVDADGNRLAPPSFTIMNAQGEEVGSGTFESG